MINRYYWIGPSNLIKRPRLAMVGFSNGQDHSKTEQNGWPFKNWTPFENPRDINHPNSERLWYSSPHCIHKSLVNNASRFWWKRLPRVHFIKLKRQFWRFKCLVFWRLDANISNKRHILAFKTWTLGLCMVRWEEHNSICQDSKIVVIT